MSRLKLPRTLANALLGDLQSGTGTGVVGAASGTPRSVYPCAPADFAATLAVIQSRGEAPFACYGHAAEPGTGPVPAEIPYQILLGADTKGVILLRAFQRSEDAAAWRELDIELDHD